MRRKKLKVKSNAQIHHFKKRVLERCGIELLEHDIQYLRGRIKRGKYKGVIKQSNRVYIYDIDFKDIHCFIVYDKMRKTPITVLTEEMTSLDEIEEKVNTTYSINSLDY